MNDLGSSKGWNECRKEQISAWVDGELSQREALLMIDHLVDCPSCQEFYRRVRTLDTVLQSEGIAGMEEEPSPEVWQQILASTELESEVSRTRTQNVWVAIAATLLLLLGLALIRPQSQPTAASMEVFLEEDRGQMSEARFLALTTELLRADRRYQMKMLEVMLTVDEYLEHHEISNEELLPREEVEGDAEKEGQHHHA